MEKLKVEFENCYGIRKLQYDFDFKNRRTFLIYSPNGVMKTSFAKTFLDISNGNDSKDLIYPESQTKRIAVDENNTKIENHSVFVNHIGLW
jgi:predicted ATP-binding protein involved in virulence